MNYIALLGRQPELSIAELEQLFPNGSVKPVSSEAATFSADTFDIQKVGGTIKAGRISLELHQASWEQVSNKVVQHFVKSWQGREQKQTVGISVYGWDISPRDVQRLGLILKSRVKKTGTSVRLVPNTTSVLSSAVSHHNKLGLSENKTEVLIVRGSDKVFIAESTGAQNISALAARDQSRPKRDAFVGMLPPKLALMMVNLAGRREGSARLLDPFCGTGVVLQEAALLGFDVYGTDLAEKMVDYTRINLAWLKDTHRVDAEVTVNHGDAMDTTWQQPIDYVVGETYLGQPFSAPPAPDKLQKVRGNCNEIISKFLLNLAPQLKKGTPLCLAVPAWRDEHGTVTQLPLVDEVFRLGYKLHEFKNVDTASLLYFREDQVVARQLLILARA